MLEFDGRPLALHYASVLAHELGYTERIAEDSYESPGKPALQQGHLYVPGVYGRPTHVLVCVPLSRFRLFLTDDPLSGEPMVHCQMTGEAWDEVQLMRLCRRLQDLPFGNDAAQALIAEADFLDANPEYRMLPRLAARHITPRDKDDAPTQRERPRDWD